MLTIIIHDTFIINSFSSVPVFGSPPSVPFPQNVAALGAALQRLPKCGASLPLLCFTPLLTPLANLLGVYHFLSNCTRLPRSRLRGRLHARMVRECSLFARFSRNCCWRAWGAGEPGAHDFFCVREASGFGLACEYAGKLCVFCIYACACRSLRVRACAARV
jgi:hypothetical protein